MRSNGEAFERAEGLEPGTYFAALGSHPDGIAVYAALEVGEATQEEWNRVIGGILGIDPTDLMRRALANLHPEPAIVAAARRARASGVKVAMLSNSFGLEPYNPYEDKGLWTDCFDTVVLSEREGVRKPAPEIYRRTLDALGLTGPQCVFVDDRAGNLPPAEALGIRTVHHTTDPVATAGLLDSFLADSDPAPA
ncbi:HAD-IA family hydrolase [Streptomyces sp. ventii]|uniref:HAD-IA family hydrolase n=2 Tax=Streptomyces spiramenti TaxID=2720606 RepID=A0ABX1AIU8_9ACTN|nr:HAD-IA family hydrolase [Streptomyces spiramenti]NJP65764.1 HAD-IA family hydrolase [Streptomyces spiramenti]